MRAPLLSRALLGSLVIAVAAPAVRAQTTSPAAGWTVEPSVGALRAPRIAGANVTAGGTAPLAALRVARAVGPRWRATAGVAYGEAGSARREVYERPNGTARTDTYDYRALLATVGAEYGWPVGRAEGVLGAEAGVVRDGWRVATHVDPANLEPPRSSFDAKPVAAGRVGLRYPLAPRLAASAATRVVAGAGTFDGRRAVVVPEAGVRWRF